MAKHKRRAVPEATGSKVDGSGIDGTEGDGENNPSRDPSKHVHQRNRLEYTLDIRERTDFTERQRVILEAALEKHTRCVLIDGIWGCGKTHLVTLASLKLLNSGRVKTILYVRNPIEASANSRVGYLAGSLSEKMAPYNAVLEEQLSEMLPKAQIDRLIKDKRIECIPTGFMQGRSLNCTAIIVDESASMSWEDLSLLITRCGEFTRIFFIGDSINQLYLRGESGFARFFRAFDDMESKENGVYAFELKQPSDIVRSGFARFALRKLGIIRE